MIQPSRAGWITPSIPEDADDPAPVGRPLIWLALSAGRTARIAKQMAAAGVRPDGAARRPPPAAGVR